jgi:hypothetical protein
MKDPERFYSGMAILGLFSIYIAVCTVGWNYSPAFRVGFKVFFGLN